MQNDSLPPHTHILDDTYTSRLAAKTFLLSPTSVPVGSWSANTARDFEAEPGESIDPSFIFSESQRDPDTSNTQNWAVPISQKNLSETSECCQGNVSSGGSNDHPVLEKGPTYSQTKNWESMGDVRGYLQAQPLNLQPDYIDDSWFSALKLAGLGDLNDFPNSVSRLEDSGQPCNFDSWL